MDMPLHTEINNSLDFITQADHDALTEFWPPQLIRLQKLVDESASTQDQWSLAIPKDIKGPTKL